MFHGYLFISRWVHWFQVLTDGYAAHLNTLTSSDSTVHPLGNLRISMRKAGFSFPVHQASTDDSRKNRVRKTASLPTRHQPLSVCGPAIAVTDEGNMIVGSEQDVDVWLPTHCSDWSYCEISSADFDSYLLTDWRRIVLVWCEVIVSVPVCACLYVIWQVGLTSLPIDLWFGIPVVKASKL